MNLQSRKRLLLTLRIMWGAMIEGALTFAVIVYFLVDPEKAKYDTTMSYLPWIMMAVTAPVGYVIRMYQYKQNQVDGRVAPEKYSTGNIMLFATIEVPTFLSLIVTMNMDRWGVHSLPAVLGVILIAINFPTGRPLSKSDEQTGTNQSRDDNGGHVVSERD